MHATDPDACNRFPRPQDGVVSSSRSPTFPVTSPASPLPPLCVLDFLTGARALGVLR